MNQNTDEITWQLAPSTAEHLRRVAMEMRSNEKDVALRALTEWLSWQPSQSTLALMEDLEDVLTRLPESKDIADLVAMVKHQAVALDKMTKLATADLEVVRLGLIDGCFGGDISGRAVAVLAGHLAAWMRDNEAVNYTESGFSHYDAPFLFIVQRTEHGKLSPHQARMAAEARAEAAEARVAVLEAQLAGTTPPAG